jgi:Leucine-rich repeat (LRR) protein
MTKNSIKDKLNFGDEVRFKDGLKTYFQKPFIGDDRRGWFKETHGSTSSPKYYKNIVAIKGKELKEIKINPARRPDAVGITTDDEEIEFKLDEHLYLNCSYRNLKSLEIFNINIKRLDCESNQLTALKISNCTNLQTLKCDNNQLPTLNIQNLTNLQYLSCDNNQLPSLNITGLTNLQKLACENNQLTSLNIKGLTNLQILNCSYNQLTELNVKGSINLQKIWCDNNQLTSLNISDLTNLQYLRCNNNQLSILNISGLTNLQILHCYNNQLTELNLSGLTNLQVLYYDRKKTKLIGKETTRLNESKYNQFKKQTFKSNPKDILHRAIKEINMKLDEINNLIDYTTKIKGELNEGDKEIEYLKRTKNSLNNIHNKLKEAFKKINSI